MEKSKRSEATLTARMNDEDDHGMNGDSNLSQTVCVHQNKENGQGTMTLTDNNEERLTKNEGSSMHDASCIGINYAHRFPMCFRSLHTLLGFSLCTSRHQFNCCHCTNFSISDLYENSLQRFTLRKWSCEVLSLHLPSVAADRRQL